MESKVQILVVDRNRRNLELLAQFLTQRGYEPITAISLAEFDQALQHVERLALALVDLTGFDPGIWQRCDQLRQAAVPFLMLSAASRSQAIQHAGAAHGARGVLVKPLTSESLLDLLRSLLPA
jgi:DNA-binding response OmpR family regulator